MMSSYIVGAGSQGHEFLGDKIPTIFEIQDFIENAWDIGINSQGREETGGIKGTRKYIGTPDVNDLISYKGGDPVLTIWSRHKQCSSALE